MIKVAQLEFDTRNGFNKLKQLSVLLTIHHCCSRESNFSFNCYHLQFILIVRNREKLATIMNSKEGVAQGDPLSMLLYGTASTPLAELIQKEYNDVVQS